MRCGSRPAIVRRHTLIGAEWRLGLDIPAEVLDVVGRELPQIVERSEVVRTHFVFCPAGGKERHGGGLADPLLGSGQFETVEMVRCRQEQGVEVLRWRGERPDEGFEVHRGPRSPKADGHASLRQAALRSHQRAAAVGSGLRRTKSASVAGPDFFPTDTSETSCPATSARSAPTVQS